MLDHKDGIIEAARHIDSTLHSHADNRSAALTEVNAYLSQNPTFASTPERANALTHKLTVRGDLPDAIIDEFTKAPADRANDPLAKVLHDAVTSTIGLGWKENDIQKNAKTLAEGQAAHEALTAFTPDQWNKLFKNGAASHDDVKATLHDSKLNLTGDQRKALTDVDSNFDALRVGAWRHPSTYSAITRDGLQNDLTGKDGGSRQHMLDALDKFADMNKPAESLGFVSVNVEAGEGWQNIAAKALGYDMRLKTRDDWKAVPQTDINRIYGLANYYSQQHTVVHPGKVLFQVPEQFRASS